MSDDATVTMRCVYGELSWVKILNLSPLNHCFDAVWGDMCRDRKDLKSIDPRSCGFDSRRR